MCCEERDNVVVALEAVQKGATFIVSGQQIAGFPRRTGHHELVEPIYVTLLGSTTNCRRSPAAPPPGTKAANAESRCLQDV